MGYIPLGFAFGAFAVTQGFPIWLTVLSAACIYAGSMEFTAVSLILGGVDLIQTAITAFFVNFRHIFYGLAFPLRRIRSSPARFYGIHALTDEAYALVTATLGAANLGRATYLSGRVIFGIELLCHLYWVCGVFLGAVVSGSLPFNTDCLSFALPALFITLAIDAFKQSRYRFLGVIATIWGLLAALFFGKYMLLGALSLFSLTIVLYLVWLFKRHPERIPPAPAALEGEGALDDDGAGQLGEAGKDLLGARVALGDEGEGTLPYEGALPGKMAPAGLYIEDVLPNEEELPDEAARAALPGQGALPDQAAYPSSNPDRSQP